MSKDNIENNEYLNRHLNDLFILDNDSLKNIRQIYKSVAATGQNAFNMMSAVGKSIAPIIQQLNEMGKTIAPIIQYLDDNKDKIDNFNNSLDKLVTQYSETENISTDEAITIIENLIDEGRLFINEDWTIEIVDEQTVNKPKSKLTLREIITLFGIAVNIFTSTPNINIDNSVTNNEYHYHINQTEQVNNEHLVMKQDTSMYFESDENSDVITTLQIGDIVHSVITEGDWTMIIVLNEDNQIKLDGWIKSNFINPVIE